MYGNKIILFLKELFPNQFDTVPHSIIWSIVYIIDVVIVFAVSHLLGIPLPIARGTGNIRLTGYLIAGFALFCLESFVYNKIRQ